MSCYPALYAWDFPKARFLYLVLAWPPHSGFNPYYTMFGTESYDVVQRWDIEKTILMTLFQIEDKKQVISSCRDDILGMSLLTYFLRPPKEMHKTDWPI